MEKEIRDLGNGRSEMILTFTSASERDRHSRALPLELAPGEEMAAHWVNDMQFRVAPKPAPIQPPPGLVEKLPDEPAPKTVDPAGLQPAATKTGTVTLPPLTGLLAADAATLQKAKFADIETAAVEAGYPGTIDKNKPRANLVGEIIAWREKRGG